MSRNNTQIVEVFRGKTLAQNSTTTISENFPLGEGWSRLILHFHQTLTIGTGSTLIAEGALGILKALNFRTDKGENCYRNVPGRALYRINEKKNMVAEVMTAIVAADGTYSTQLSLWFIDPMSVRPLDTILDTSRYRSVELSIQIGGVADFLSTVGSSSNITTLDCYVERIKGNLPEAAKPNFYQEIGIAPPVNPANQTYIDLERAENLAYKRIHVQSVTGATAGTSHSGVVANSVIADFTIETDKGDEFRDIKEEAVNAYNVVDYRLAAAVTGNYTFDVMRDGSIHSALYSGDLSRARVRWNNDTLSTSQVSLAYEAVRNLL